MTDSFFGIGVLIRGGDDGVEVVAVLGRQGTPAQDRGECVGGAGAEPGEVAVGTGQGDRESGDGLAQAFQAHGLGKAVTVGEDVDGYGEGVGGFAGQEPVPRLDHPRAVMDLALGILGQGGDSRLDVHRP
ncbi:hypothetical protein [Kitasatospora sp. NPDC005748]|uniref:hypothetical protein n=1 Tax=Kitasatospora sp. NPDC005748 TaxID=3157063 RepID=UPI0033C6A1DC